MGELKTLLALAIGDEEATREGCDWIRHFEQLNESRRRVYSCIESLLNLGDAAPYSEALQLLFSPDTLQQAKALLNRDQRFFDLNSPGLTLEGCDMHRRLLAAYDKIHAC